MEVYQEEGTFSPVTIKLATLEEVRNVLEALIKGENRDKTYLVAEKQIQQLVQYLYSVVALYPST